MVNDLGENAFLLRESDELIKFGQAQDGRFFDDDVPAGLDPLPRGVEMFVVRRSDAEKVDPARKKVTDRVFSGVISERSEPSSFTVGRGPVTGAGRGSGELDAEGAGGLVVDAMVSAFEKRRVSLVKDHAHSDHAAAKDGQGGGSCGRGGH